jgi:hypothetical protein
VEKLKQANIVLDALYFAPRIPTIINVALFVLNASTFCQLPVLKPDIDGDSGRILSHLEEVYDCRHTRALAKIYDVDVGVEVDVNDTAVDSGGREQTVYLESSLPRLVANMEDDWSVP